MKFLLVSSLLLSLTSASDVEFDGQMILNIDHSLDHGTTWEHRGTVTVHSTRSGSSSVDQLPLRAEQKKELKNLCEKQGLYLLKISGHVSQVDLGVHRTYASACNVLEANLVDSLTLHFDWRGKLSAVSLATSHDDKAILTHPQAIEVSKKGLNFKTKVHAQHMENGPVPDTADFIQKMEQDKMNKKEGATTDNRSFLAKYWMYIVPIVIFMAINGATSPENGGGR